MTLCKDEQPRLTGAYEYRGLRTIEQHLTGHMDSQVFYKKEADEDG